MRHADPPASARLSRSALSSVCTLLGGLLLLGLLGCGEQEIRVIERLPAPISSDRGRVQVRDGSLLTDKGTRLRGVTFGIDAAPEAVFDAEVFDELTGQSGLNAIHIYLENYAQESGSHAAQGDHIVELAAEAGAYVILGIGGGNANGSFDLKKVRSFWDFYAPRYADRTHVIYEIQNIPENNGCEPFTAETLEMERDAYARIRELAPSTHVVLFSFVATPTLEQADSALDAVASLVDWSKASVAFHADPRCVDADARGAVFERLRERGATSFASELLWGLSAADTLVLEQQRVGWMSFAWLVRSRDMARFRAEHDAASVTWCPDFGLWPRDAEKCTDP